MQVKPILSTERLTLATSLLLAASTFACELGGGVCTTVFVPAVRVTVLDADGLPVDGSDVRVEWREEGEESSDTWRECYGDSLYNCGRDAGGTYIIRATFLEGKVIERSVRARMAGCHVRSEELTIEVDSES